MVRVGNKEKINVTISLYLKREADKVIDNGEFGSILLHILLLFFTAGIGNIIYGYYNYNKTRSVVHIKVE